MILPLLFTFLQEVFSSNCSPYGIRVFLGHYFSFLKDQEDVIRIVFNTEGQCSNEFTLAIVDNNSLQHIMLASLTYYESELLNMTKIYENSQPTYLYETWIHTFKISIKNLDLNLTTNYSYKILNKEKVTDGPFNFHVPIATANQQFLVFGDMDSNWAYNVSKDTFNWIDNEIQNNKNYDAIIYTGDMGYDLESDNCQRGDYWLRNMSYFARRYPFMATAGNHEQGNNTKFDYFRANFGTLYLKEFNTNNYLNDFYSFNIGLVHFINFNPIKAVYQNDDYNVTNLIVEQMRNDLKHANDNRNNIPWIIVYTHYPIYCSEDKDQCYNNYKYLSQIEDLFVEFKVDLYLCGHQHNYQRNKPYYQNKIAQFQTKNFNIIYNYSAPVSIIEGIGGTEHGGQNNTYDPKPFMVTQSPFHGVGRLTILNSSHLYFEHINVTDDVILDNFWIERTIYDETTNKDLFEIIVWTIFALLLVIAGVSIYYQHVKEQKLKVKLTQREYQTNPQVIIE